MAVGLPEGFSFRKVGTGIVAMLVLVVLVLGYVLYQTVTERAVPYPPEKKTQNSAGESFTFLPLTDDERVALDTSSANMFTQPTAVQKVATVAETLAIGADCRVSPVVLKVQNGASLALKNYDDVPHTITVNTHTSKTRAYLVPAHGSITMTADFGKTGASYSIYSMSCEKSSATIGMVMVME